MENQKKIEAEKRETRIVSPFPLKRLFSVSEAGIYLGKGEYTIRTMVWNEVLPVVRDGRKILLDVRDLDAWIEKNKLTYSMRVEDERPENGKKKSRHAD